MDAEALRDVALASGVTAAGAAATRIGFKIARMGPRTWIVPGVISLTVLVATAVSLNVERLAFVPPTSWLVGASARWITLSLAGAMTLGVLAAKVPKQDQRRALLILTGVVILRSGTLPFIGPLLTRGELRTMKTHVNRGDVCLQSTGYTCGPAAAVTALRRLGLHAEEGELGLMCGTDFFFGTADDRLAAELAEHYGEEGLIVAHRYVESIDELRLWPVAIAVIHFNMFIDHYVTVLAFHGDKVTIADPLGGEEELSVEELEKKWNHAAILLKRESVKSPPEASK
jgi:hypothetical protein